MNSTYRILALSLLILTIAGTSLNLAHADRITSVVGFSYKQGVLSIGFRSADGELIPHVKVVWYVWNSSGFPPLSIANSIIIGHTGNYTVQGIVVINVISFDVRTNATGLATLVYNMPNGCSPYMYLVNGAPYNQINHLNAVGSC